MAICEPEDGAAFERERAFAPELAAYRDVDALLGGTEIDLAVVALPAGAVPGAATRLLRAGKHCLIEKTVARTAAEFEPVVAAAETSGARLQVHFPWRFHPCHC